MSSQTSYSSSSNMLFQTMNDDLNASLATADELSKEFNSLFHEASTPTHSQTSPSIPRERLESDTIASPDSGGGSNGRSTVMPFSLSYTSTFPLESKVSSNRIMPSSPIHTPSPHNSPKSCRRARSPLPHTSSNSYSYRQPSPSRSPHMQRHGPQSLQVYREPNLSSSTASSFNESSPVVFHNTSNLSPYDANQKGRRSPRLDRSPSPRAMNLQMSSTLPRNFGGFKQTDEAMQQQKNPSKWNESDLDASYDRKPHSSYDKKEWLRPSVPNSSWRESNLDGPPPAPSPKKERLSHTLLPAHHASLPRNTRISVPPDMVSPNHTPYHSQPIISRISIPPASANTRQHKPIPLSVIMRLQNPHWATAPAHHPSMPLPREFYLQPQQPPPPELKQPHFYGEVLNPGDIDAELERLDLIHHMPDIHESPSMSEAGGEANVRPALAPRPLSPTRLQPVVAPEAQIQEIPDLEELLRIRAEIPRALKRRGSVDQSRPLKKTSLYQPNQYKQLIDKLFRRKGLHHKGEPGSEASSSSEEEESLTPSSHGPVPQTSTPIPQDHKGYHSILRQSKQNKPSGRRARLSPLVLLLDAALVGELDTVQRAVQEMNDPSQPNDEGITALHNAICGGHYNVVDFLVRIGANVSAPDSHGWTPLHCAASCNDRPLCEFLVRNGAAVMAVTESDGATASQKCDPYAVGFEECENFLRGVEEAMGMENSGVLYALWSYPSQAPDELSFKEGDMVTILQKQDRVDWWWASLCGREGFVPNNYFGLFPKVRPRSLC